MVNKPEEAVAASEDTAQPIFPQTVLQKLAPHSFLYAHLNPAPPVKPVRPNGRQLHEHRKPLVHTGSLNHANGSAIVRQGGTVALCGIRAELLMTEDIPDWRPDRYEGRQGQSETRIEGREAIEILGLVVPNVELRTGCTWDNLPDRPPSDLAQVLSAQLMNSILTTNVVDFQKLVIQSDQEDKSLLGEITDTIKAFWTLYFDILFISLDGNPFDAAWTACMAALRDTTLPCAVWDDEYQTVICEDDMAEATQLFTAVPPTSCSYSIFKSNLRNTDVVNMKGNTTPRTRDGQEYWVLADPSANEEEQCCDQVSVLLGPRTVKGRHQLFQVEKTGGVTLGMSELNDVIGHAETRWPEWTALFEALPRPG